MLPNDVDTTDSGVAEAAAGEGGAGTGRGKRAYVQSIFAEIAPCYDLLNHVLSLNIDRRWRQRAIAALQWSRAPTGVYLDLCAGTLDVAAALAREVGFDGRVVAADFAEPMLRAGGGKTSGIVVWPVAADALQLPLAASSVAGAVVAFGIRNVADLDASLREAHRVLVDGARFVILEFTTPRSAVVRAGYHLYFHYLLPVVGRLISGHKTAYHYLPRSVASFPTEETLAAHMVDAGFQDVTWDRLTFGIAAVHHGTK